MEVLEHIVKSRRAKLAALLIAAHSKSEVDQAVAIFRDVIDASSAIELVAAIYSVIDAEIKALNAAGEAKERSKSKAARAGA